jgi:flagellar P-ring protein FlgI
MGETRMNQTHSGNWRPALAMAILFLLSVVPVYGTPIKNLCEIQGARNNILKGAGYVVGLAGTGDQTQLSVVSQQRILERLGIEIDSLQALSGDNAAFVVVTAELPPFVKEGTRIDVKVDALGDCESLEGGMLIETYLYGPGDSRDATVYAVAQGPLSVGGFNADASGGTSVRQNHVTSGRIPMGATIEAEVPSTITDGQRILLQLKQPDFNTADTIREAIDNFFGENTALAFNPGAIRVTIPAEDQGNLVRFIAELLEIDVNHTAPSRVVINERTGTIVIGGDVVIKPCQVAHGSLTIKIAKTPAVLPPLTFTDPDPVVTEMTDLEVEEIQAHLMPVEGTSAGEVAQALNRLKVTPRDMISIFQALREAGALSADLEIM